MHYRKGSGPRKQAMKPRKPRVSRIVAKHGEPLTVVMWNKALKEMA